MNCGRNAGLLLSLLALSAALHFFRLSEPDTVVFDEVHFGSYVNAYCGDGAYFFDIHPPHAKLLIAALAAVGGYRGQQSFDVIHAPIDQVSPALLRLGPALAGTALPLVIFGLLSLLGASRWAAFLGALAVVLDNGLLLQTRIIALDGILLLATFAALSSFLMAQRQRRRPARTAWALVAGALAGFAVGCKFIGLVALVVIGLCAAAPLLRNWNGRTLRRTAIDGLTVLVAAGGVYFAGWALHFGLLDQPGPGDVWGRPSGDLLADIARVHVTMVTEAYNVTASHPYASSWWSWPLMLRPVSYWTSGIRHLHFLGNPVVWWGSSLGLALVIAVPALLRTTNLSLPGSAWPRRLWVPLCGYALSLLPLAGLDRVMFLYHYLMPLVFGLCAVVLWLDHVSWIRPGGWRDQRVSFYAATLALVLGFAAVSPFTLPYVEAPRYQAAVFSALPGWR
jgi:dolichyl-phosphate-mannose--protein O-mannosyl transferase